MTSLLIGALDLKAIVLHIHRGGLRYLRAGASNLFKEPTDMQIGWRISVMFTSDLSENYCGLASPGIT